jgi:hypothetical protein
VRKLFLLVSLAIVSAVLPFPLPPEAPGAGGGSNQGQGLILELDNDFIKAYENRVTITSEYKIAGLSAIHLPAKDGEIHCGGWSYEARLACVAEVMNAATLGKQPRLALTKAANTGQKVTVTGAWRLWGEHGGVTAQIQQPRGTEPPDTLPGEYPSNPDHIFEIHPITSLKVGTQVTDATASIGDTPGFTPYDVDKAFIQGGYEKLTCKIIPKGDRTRITTRSLGYNFAQFVIRLNENPVELEDGHAVICSVFDHEGELHFRGRRMVFIKGTAADTEVAVLKKDARLRVIGIPRISLKLVQWRLDHRNDPGHDVSPLDWNLPYEMIIVAAEPIVGDGD